MRGLELCVDWSCAWRTTPVAKPDWIEEPSVTTATVTMSRSLRALGGSMAASRRGVVLVVRASVTSITRGLELRALLANVSQNYCGQGDRIELGKVSK